MTGLWSRWRDEELRSVQARQQWRSLRSFDAIGPRGSLVGMTSPVVSFASNDYLGLSAHPQVIVAATAALAQWGTSAGASRLVVGSRPIHHELEAALASWKGTEAALLFPSGFSANLAVLATLAGPDVTVCSDEQNHASIIDGCRLARADVAVYRHLDVDDLSTKLARTKRRAMVVTDSVFSMDGDAAPIDAIVECCARFGALLVLDEAHSLLEPAADIHGRGVDVLRVGTLSKTLASIGGFVAGAQEWIDLLVNRARPFIFTTAPTPADMAAALAALGILRSAEGDRLVARLRRHVHRLAPQHPSPIVPLIVGSEPDALAAAAAMLARGLLVPAIRPPTVCPGTSRLRVAFSAAHTDAEVDALVGALDEIRLLGVVAT